MFDSIGEFKLGSPARTLMSWCPSSDMIAFVTDSDPAMVWVHRLNGQRVWASSPIKKGRKATQIQWKYDGRVLGIIFDDGALMVLQGSNGKVIYSVDNMDEKLSYVNWAEMEAPQGSKPNASSLIPAIDIDVMQSMPRLPPLPSSVQPFSRISLEEGSPNVDMLVTGTKNGSFRLSLYGVFSIGSVSIPSIGNDAVISQISASPDLERFHLLVKSSQDTWHYTTACADFVRRFGQQYLPEVSLTPAKVLALLEYIHECGSIVRSEVKAIAGAASKALSWLSDQDLVQGEDVEPKVAVQCALYDTLITGNSGPSVGQWLTQELGEKGIRKWHKVCMASYEQCQRVLFENLIPACERLLVLLSRLRGLAKWHERGVPLGLDSENFDTAIEQASTIAKLADSCVWKINEEEHYFKAFVSWLQIAHDDVPDATPFTGKPVIEDPGSARTVDVAKYITSYLTECSLEPFVTSKGSKKHEHLPTMIKKIGDTCRSSFTNARKCMREQVSFGQVIPLGTGDDVYHQRVVGDVCYVARQLELSIMVYRIQGDDVQTANVTTKGRAIVEAQFINDEELMILEKASDEAWHMGTINYTQLTYALDAQAVEMSYSHTKEFGSEFKPAAFAFSNDRGVGCLVSTDQKRYQFFR
uniref:Anaphase-promoting complex subunit 4 n=1 Tax=Blastobotrys adeninivorans TaxID=409370 RepID=A0A060T2Y6_BLAAD